MIPKVIHACWFGGNELPEEYQRYIDGWKKLHPTWEVKIWRDEDFAPYLDDSAFVKDCVAKKKYAFLADYFRFVVLYEFGGVYIDTDVELLKPLDYFLGETIFIGYIFDSLLGTATIGAEPHNPIIKDWLEKLLSDYEKSGNLCVSNNWFTQFFLDNFNDFVLDGKETHLECGVSIYPKDYFERITLSRKSRGGYAVHHCAGSWRKGKSLFKRILKKILPKKAVEYFVHRRCLKMNPFYRTYLECKNRR